MASIVIKNELLDKIKEFGGFSEETLKTFNEYSRYSSNITIDLDSIGIEDNKILCEALRENKARNSYLKVKNYIEILEDSSSAIIKGLQNFEKAFIEELRKTPHHWVFMNIGGRYLPYLVESVKYRQPYGRGDNYTPDYVEFKLKYNGQEGLHTKTVCAYEGEVEGLTVAKGLENLGILFENEELCKDFFESEKRYLIEKRCYNKQYKGVGVFVVGKGYREELVEVRGNFINDEEINRKGITLKTKSLIFKTEDNEDLFERIPCHPYLYVFSLSTHENGYIHIDNLEDYVYDDSLREKLVLPETQKDLLDILSNDLNILSGDIIKGKSSGTTILCKGKPGVGKTLTAEVYSEITHKPLYKINSGQLGTTPYDVEKKLEEILKRAERWGAVMLLDEADTYICKRGNSLEQNAIVAAFLRTLEYFNGLLFMTTNRVDDVDEAIESRCIAQIIYETPSKENAVKIWNVLAKEFELNLKPSVIEELTEHFTQISGRDIKELLRLTGRYCKAKGFDLEFKHFLSCAQFRGL